MAFQIPSSSPPSTPDSRSHGAKKYGGLASMSNNISTTPAGPPPSSAPSFTPAGQPPSTVFGSSMFGGTGPSKPRFTESPGSQRPPSASNVYSAPRSFLYGKKNTPARPSGLNNFQVPSSSPFGSDFSPRHDSRTADNAEDDNSVDENQDEGAFRLNQDGNDLFDFKSMLAARPRPQFPSSPSARNSPRSSRKPAKRGSITAQHAPRLTELPRTGNDSTITVIAGNMIKRLKAAALYEPDDMILQTESILSSLGEDLLDKQQPAPPEHELPTLFSVKSTELVQLWSRTVDSSSDDELNDLLQAVEIASLWLTIHHPAPRINPRRTLQPFSRDLSVVQSSQESPLQSLPEVLLSWLDDNQGEMDQAFEAVLTMRPNCTAHELFWETVYGLAIRGKLEYIIRLFNEADFRFAATALDDGYDQPGYRGAQLQSVQDAVYRARDTVQMCPAVRDGDWHTIGEHWTQYRHRVSSDLEQLIEIAEGDGYPDDEEDDYSQTDNFKLTGKRTNLSQTTRRAMSRIPWLVYENLKILHRLLLGSTAEILAFSQDYLEASMTLTVWWDGDGREKICSLSSAMRRPPQPVDRSQMIIETSPDLSGRNNPYLERLKAAFLYVTDPETENGFAINSAERVEVGLGAALQGDVNSMLGIVLTISTVVASALAEVGVAAGWLEQSQLPALDAMDQDDLDVLNYGQEQRRITKDDILTQYIDCLFDKEEIRSGGVAKEGWQIAIPVATRLDDRSKSLDSIHKLLDQLQLDSEGRMNKLLEVCTDLNLLEEARQVSESPSKLAALTSLLTSYSLVQSAPYPPPSSLDPTLHSLLTNPSPLLRSVQQTSGWGAGMLQYHLSGYASLRRFYDLRDNRGPGNGSTNSSRNLKPLARKRAAARVLIAALNSAADSIYGGLYDETRKSAIEVDSLLPLLGEATALVGQNPRVLSIAQMYDLLAGIEDLSVVNERVRGACEECLSATMRSFGGSGVPSPRDMLRKSMSGNSGGGSGKGSEFSFSLMGSEMVDSGVGTKSVGSSGVLVEKRRAGKSESEDVSRGWDWRELASKDGEQVTGEFVISKLRGALVKELAMAELEGDWPGA
ncbi:MAG: hypothetical protein Q9227_000125 [Pyrenula ochraceoflavens]